MADNIFSGLESLGFEGLDNMSIYEEKKEEKAKRKAVVTPNVSTLHEKDFLFDKTTVCPCCEMKFKTRTVKAPGARLLGTDPDLRPRHDGIDITKYDVIVCPRCGYAATTRFFPNLVSVQRKAIKEKISQNFKARSDEKETLTYDEAIEAYKMALLNAVVKGAKASEKAFICLKISWLYRGKAEEIGEDNSEYVKAKDNELEFTNNAYEGFEKAVSCERFPMCGMDETTVDYLLASLGFLTDHIDVSAKLVSKILTSKIASSRIKDRARELKEEIIKKYNEKK